ncbi:MAG TPA: hypothetical protein VGA70_06185, partial [Longimicrobiales bacterium]
MNPTTDTASAPRVSSGSFLLGPTDPATLFIPEEFDEEARMLAGVVEEFVLEQVVPRMDAIEAMEEGVLVGLFKQTGELGVFAVD